MIIAGNFRKAKIVHNYSLFFINYSLVSCFYDLEVGSLEYAEGIYFLGNIDGGCSYGFGVCGGCGYVWGYAAEDAGASVGVRSKTFYGGLQDGATR